MKHFLSTLILLSTFCTSQSAILTINNNATEPAMYSNSTDAYTAASPGDTLYFHGSSVSYGVYLDISKKLTIIGPGKFPNEPLKLKAHFRYIRLMAGADGSVLIGMHSTDGIFVSAPNILVSGCIATGISVDAGNIIVRDNVFYHTGTVNPYAVSGDGASTNIVIENNIIYSQMYRIKGATLRNNIFARGWDLFKNCSNLLLENNIFYGPYLRNCNSCTFNNNISFGGSSDSLPASYSGSNNIIGTNPLFENAPLSFDPGVFHTYNFRLSNSSPAKGKGTDAKDIGLYGGGTPFTISGNANIPQIISSTVENRIVPPGGKVKIIIISTKPED